MTPGRLKALATLGAILLAAALAFMLLRGPAHKQATVTVFAGAGMTDALLEVAGAFEHEHSCTVRFSFAASSTLARQVAAGAEPDVFISAHPKWMDFLEEEGAIQKGSRHDLLGNRMVCIAPKSASPETTDLAGWMTSLQSRIAMGDPNHVPAGLYGAQALESMGLWDDVRDHLAPVADTRAALRAVAIGECSAGIVYATDARASDNVIEVACFSEERHDPIRFPAALCKQADPLGTAFLDFLHTTTARTIFEDHGFSCLGEGRSQNRALLARNEALTSAERQALSLSLRVALSSVLVLLIPGILTGWLLARCRFPGKSIVEALTHLPMVVPPVVTGYLLLSLLGKHGYLGKGLDRLLGLQLGFSLWAAIIASAVMAFPLMVRSVRLAIELVDTNMEEAAMMSGAGPVVRFLSTTLPLAAPGILAGIVLAFSRSLGEFGATMTFAGNIPGETQTIPLAIYTALQRPGGEGGVLRLALLSVLIALAALWASRQLETRLRRRQESL